MSSSYQKGNQYELMVKAYLESRGWLVAKQNRKAQFIGPGRVKMVGADFFDRFDMVAVKEDEKPVFIQVSTMKCKSKKIKQVMGFPLDPKYGTVQVWLKIDKKRAFEIFQAPDFESVGIAQIGR